mgnify:FL=1
MSTAAKTTAVRYPIELERGITKRIRLRMAIRNAPIDLTGYTAKMQVRVDARSDDVIIDLSTENGGIEIDGPAGIVTLIFSHTETIKLDGAAETDLLLIDADGAPSRVLYGPVTAIWTVTR